MNKSHLVPIRLSLLSSSLKNSFFRGASMALATALAALTLAAPASAWDRPNIITATIPTSASTVQLVLDPVRHKVYAGTEVYQGVDTVSNVNTVQVIDEKTHAVIQKITVPVEANSLAIDPIHGKVYVSSQYSGVVYVIDESTDTLVDSITVVAGANYTPGVGFNYSFARSAIDPVKEELFEAVYEPAGSFVAVVDLRHKNSIKQFPLPSAQPSLSPNSIIVDPIRKVIYVANGQAAPFSILALDEESGKIIGSISVPDWTGYFAIDEERGILYASLSGFVSNITKRILTNGSVIVIDQNTFTITDTIVTAPIYVTGEGFAVTEEIALDPLNHTLYVANGHTANILAIDTRTNQITATIPTPGGFNVRVGVDPLLRKVFVSDFFNNVVYDISAGPPRPWENAHR